MQDLTLISELSSEEQKLTWAFRALSTGDEDTQTLLVSMLHQWFGLSFIEEALVSFARLVDDINQAIDDAFGPMHQPWLQDSESWLLCLVAVSLEGPGGIGTLILGRNVPKSHENRIMVRVCEVSRVLKLADFHLPINLNKIASISALSGFTSVTFRPDSPRLATG